MGFTITDDNGTIQVRASIGSRDELDEIIGRLEKHREKFTPRPEPAATKETTRE